MYRFAGLLWAFLWIALELIAIKLYPAALIPIMIVGSLIILGGLVLLVMRYDPTSGEAD